jgi:Ni/Co efflux regulator RcnB
MMMRALAIATMLCLGLPTLSLAQTDSSKTDTSKPDNAAPSKPDNGTPPAAAPNEPAKPAQPGKPPRPSAGNPRSPGANSDKSERTQYARPRPPRGNQFFHRGEWIARIHGPVFVYPHGWHYRRWYIGARLPSLFWAPTYFYTDYVTLGLEEPAPGYDWIRFGPDLLLVNIATGEIEDVVYGVFL